jgi:protein-disulfide isomerase
MRNPLILAAIAAVIATGAWAQEATTEEAAPAEDSATSGNAATEEAAAEAPAEGEEAAAEDLSVIQDMAQGAEDAPVTVIEYGSFTCPHCAAWHEESYEPLKEEFIDTGKVQFIFREVYFDRPGLWASMIARCGGEMRFFGIHDMIYAQQQEWIGDGEGATIAENLRTIGRSAGLDDATLEACLTDEARAEALVAWFQGNAEADDIQGTPTFIINGEKHSNMAWEEMRGIIEAELAEAGQ